MKQWLAEQGLLRAESGETEKHQSSLLLQELERSFSSDALLSQFTLLITTGVMRWLPVPWAFGATRYLWANVTAEIGQPVSQLSRPELRLMTRGKAIRETSQYTAADTKGQFGAELQAKAGATGGEVGGIEVGGSYYRGTEVGTAQKEMFTEVFWGQANGSSEEFAHPLTFRVEMGITAEMPEVLSAPGRGVRGGALGVAGWVGRRREVAEWWHRHEPFVRRFPPPERPEEGVVRGDMRLIVPSHLVVHKAPLPVPEPAYGTAAWERDDGEPVDRPVDREALDRLMKDGHPWALPAAAAVRRWAALTVAPYEPPRDLSTPGVWQVPGLDFTTMDGLQYAHSTQEVLLRLNLRSLLRNQYQLTLYGRTVTVGLEVVQTEPITPEDGAKMMSRHFAQDVHATHDVLKRTRGWKAAVSPLGGADIAGGGPGTDTTPVSSRPSGRGGDPEGEILISDLALEHARERSEERSQTAQDISERNRTGVRPHRYYKADVELLLTGPSRRLRVRVPDGLYFMVPSEGLVDPRRPAGGAADLSDVGGVTRLHENG
jgi:hypothetical protein